MIGARWALYRRLWTRTPLDLWFVAFLALGCLNVYIANLDVNSPPYTRGLLMLGRPLQGIALYLYCAEYSRVRGKTSGLMAATTGLGLLLGALSLVSTQWVSKSDQLAFITRLLPSVDLLPNASTRFNPNEIAGALAWMTPLMAGLATYRWQGRDQEDTVGARLARWAITTAFILLFGGLFLGQSRAALLGVLIALFAIAVALIPAGRWRRAALAGVLVIAAVELAFVFNVLPPADSSTQAAGGLTERDENSFSKRLGIWGSGLAIIRDYPVTGIGMAMYRDRRVRSVYPAPQPNVPHAHNEWIQIGSDLGLPGLAVFAVWQIGLATMLAQVWRRGDRSMRVAAVSIGAGLVAHAVYGLNDAIPLWDRLSFVFWWLAGLAAAHYVLGETHAG